MWETEWARQPGTHEVGAWPAQDGFTDRHPIAYAYLTVWEEHCVECTYPVCYTTCALYARRPDAHCQRFRYGIRRDDRIRGLDGAAYDIHFKRWGKLETNLCYGPVTLSTLRLASRMDRAALRLTNRASAALSRLTGNRALNRKYSRARSLLLSALTARGRVHRRDYDEFVVEVINPSIDDCGVVLEAWQDDLVYRTALPMLPGHNLHRIDFADMNLDLSRPTGRLALYISGDREARLIFANLDFVRYRQRPGVVPQRGAAPAAKVKCVVWDLDNTLWDGTLVEDGIDGVRLRPEVVSSIKGLDERGVLHSVASRNDHQLAWDALGRFGLQELFLYPEIHWGPKGESVHRIARALNLGLDSLAFVDDSAIERTQVAAANPEVRVYSDEEGRRLLALEEFDVPATEESRVRRLRYLMEARRHQEATRFGGGHDEFLRSCGIELAVFTPETSDEIERSLELLQRTNQLNLSTRRYDREALLDLLARDDVLCVATRATDRFGDYGIVGLASVELGSVAMLSDFVMSCRVAKKRVENAWFQWLFGMLHSLGYETVVANFMPTARNEILLQGLEEIGFARTGELPGGIVLGRSVKEPVPLADVASVTREQVKLPRLVRGAMRDPRAATRD